MIVKPLEQSQYDQCLSLAYTHANELGYDVDTDYINTQMRRLMIHGGSVWFTANEGRSVVGYIGGNLSNDTLQDKKIAVVSWLYLDKPYRNDVNIQQLVWFFINRCKELSVDKVIVTSTELPDINHLLEQELLFEQETILARSDI